MRCPCHKKKVKDENQQSKKPISLKAAPDEGKDDSEKEPLSRRRKKENPFLKRRGAVALEPRDVYRDAPKDVYRDAERTKKILKNAAKEASDSSLEPTRKPKIVPEGSVQSKGITIRRPYKDERTGEPINVDPVTLK